MINVIETLPENWCIKITTENAPLLQGYKKTLEGSVSTTLPREYIAHYWHKKYSYMSGYVWRQILTPALEISTEDFKVHVLKQLPEHWRVLRTEKTYKELNEWANGKGRGTDHYASGDYIHSIPISTVAPYALSVPYSNKTDAVTLPFSVWEYLVYLPWKVKKAVDQWSNTVVYDSSLLKDMEDFAEKAASAEMQRIERYYEKNPVRTVISSAGYVEHWGTFDPVQDLRPPGDISNTVNVAPMPCQYTSQLPRTSYLSNKQSSNMEQIKIPQQLLKDAESALKGDRLRFFIDHYNPFQGTMPKDKIEEYYKKFACSDWRDRLQQEFPFLAKQKSWTEEVKRETDIVNLAGPYGYASHLDAYRTDIRPELTFTHPEACLLAKKVQLMLEMSKFAQLRNGDWKPTQGIDGEVAWIVYCESDDVHIYMLTSHTRGVFGIHFKSATIAEEAVEIFGVRIVEVYNQQI